MRRLPRYSTSSKSSIGSAMFDPDTLWTSPVTKEIISMDINKDGSKCSNFKNQCSDLPPS